MSIPVCKRIKNIRVLGLFILGSLLFSCHSASQPSTKLLVVIVIDQMRDDFLRRFQPAFGQGGFNRLLREGSYFSNHWLTYSNTETAPGHAVILTGLNPEHSGIVSNQWYGKNTNEKTYSVEGRRGQNVFQTSGKEQISPVNLNGQTVGDLLSRQYPGARVFSVSNKDRAAVLLGGHHPSGVFWRHKKSHHMISSTYYMEKLPAWVERWNTDNTAPDDTVWLPFDTSYFSFAEMPPDNPYLKDSPWQGGFPHTIDKSMFGESVFQTYRIGRFLKELILREKIGQDKIPDIIAWSISSTDMIGHIYGVESREVMDVYARVDKILEDFFIYLDQTVGKENYIAALTSDHGVRRTVELEAALGNPHAFRIPKSTITKAFIDSLRATQPIPEKYNYRLIRIRGNNVFFNRNLIERLGLSFEEVRLRFSRYIAAVPGITQVVDLRDPSGEEPFLQAVRNNLDTGRMGEFALNIDPNTNYEGVLGMHGYFGEDCQHIPLILMGPGITRQKVTRQTSATDLAPTLAKILQLKNMPPGDGEPLDEIMGR